MKVQYFDTNKIWETGCGTVDEGILFLLHCSSQRREDIIPVIHYVTATQQPPQC